MCSKIIERMNVYGTISHHTEGKPQIASEHKDFTKIFDTVAPRVGC